MFGGIFGSSAPSANLDIVKIKSHQFLEENKRVLCSVEARFAFVDGRYIIFKESDIRKFYIFLNGDRNMLDNDNFSYLGIVFFDTEDSKAIKKELDEICEKYFPKPLPAKPE